MPNRPFPPCDSVFSAAGITRNPVDLKNPPTGTKKKNTTGVSDPCQHGARQPVCGAEAAGGRGGQGGVRPHQGLRQDEAQQRHGSGGYLESPDPQRLWNLGRPRPRSEHARRLAVDAKFRTTYVKVYAYLFPNAVRPLSPPENHVPLGVCLLGQPGQQRPQPGSRWRRGQRRPCSDRVQALSERQVSVLLKILILPRVFNVSIPPRPSFFVWNGSYAVVKNLRCSFREAC